MKLLDIMKRAGRSLREAKARTILTSLAIAVGAFTIVLSLAAGEGGRQYASKLISSNTDAQTIAVEPRQDALQPDLNGEAGPQEYSDSPQYSLGGITLKMLNSDDIDKLKKIDGVELVSPMYDTSAEYVTRSGSKKYRVTVNEYRSGMSYKFITEEVAGLNSDEVILGKGFIKALGFASDQEAIGKTIKLMVKKTASTTGESQEFEYKVAGVVDRNEMSFMSSTNTVLLSHDAASSLYDYSQAGSQMYGQYFGAYVRVKEGADVEAIAAKMDEIGYRASTAQDSMETMFQFINVLQGILIGFGALATLTSVFGIINTQYISVLERTQQIGLMKALGMRSRDVGRMFKLEAAWIGFLGSAFGAVLAIVAGYAGNPIINSTLNLPDGVNLLIFRWFDVAIVITGLVLVAIAAGIFPSRKAAKLDPIEALRTE